MQFASNTLNEVQNQDDNKGVTKMTVGEFLQAMPMTFGGDLPKADCEAAIALLEAHLPSMNPR